MTDTNITERHPLTREQRISAAIIHLPTGRILNWVDQSEPAENISILREVARGSADLKFIDLSILDLFTYYSIMALLPESASIYPLRYLFHSHQMTGVQLRLEQKAQMLSNLLQLASVGTSRPTLDNNARFRAEIQSECNRIQIEIDQLQQQLDTFKSYAQSDFILASLS